MFGVTQRVGTAAHLIMGARTTDADFANVSVLFPFNEGDGSVVTKDRSSNALVFTFSGEAQVDTTQKKFGNGSLLFDGTGDVIFSSSSPGPVELFRFRDGEFTVETWIRFSAGASNEGLIAGMWRTNNNRRSWIFQITASQELEFLYSTDGIGTTTITSTAQTINDNTWYHLAATRDASDDLRLFLAGTVVDTTNLGTDSFATLQIETGIGNISGENGVYLGNGGDVWLDDFRITKGIARYTTGFTPPTLPHPIVPG